MSLKVKYALFILLIHSIIALLAYQLLQEQKMYFILAEIGIIISLVISYSLYRSFIRPLQFLYTGMDAIQDKDFNVKFVKTGYKEMDRLIEVYNKMIDNIRMERTQVQEQHYFLMELIHASPAGIIILDFDDRLTDINPKARHIFQIQEQDTQKSLKDFEHPLLQQIALLKAGSSKILSSDGFEKYKCQVSHFIHKGFNRKFILIQELSKEILEAEKRAYGKVIRMMAHEVNNSIGAINSILNTMADFFEEEKSEWAEPLGIAIRRNEQMNAFMRNFAKVIRLPEPHREQTDLNQLVRNIGKLMEEQAKSQQINIHFDLSDRPVYAFLDNQQFEQLLVNLIKNSLESIHQSGIVELKTLANPSSLLVRDNGPGIKASDTDKIFTPFFSTKKEGQGVGLTLVREILSNHNAQFSLKTLADGWTEFRIVF